MAFRIGPAIVTAGFGLMLAKNVMVTPALAQAANDAPPPPNPQLGPSEPSKPARDELASIQSELDAVDNLLLQEQFDEARARLADARQRYEVLTKERGNEVPQGYVPGFVVEERIGALAQQIDEKSAQR